jgi:glycosyltransferase involved in cell wall biosynthesis
LGPSHPWRGGIAHHTASLYGALERSGHQVTLFNFRRLYPELLFPGKTQRDESEAAFSVPAEAVFDPLDPLSWVRAANQLMSTRPDRLILQWWHPFFAPGYAAVTAAARLVGCEVVMMCHNVEPHESTPIDRTLLRLAYALPNRFVVQSSAERSRLESLVGTKRAIAVAPHPRYEMFSDLTEPLTREEAKRRCGVDTEHLLLFFGLVRPYKGVDLLLEAIAGLPDDLDWELIVAGEIYGDADDYRRQITAHGLEERVRLDDHYVSNEEVPVMFRAASACVLPYRQATGSGAANVALACGTPLIMSRLATLEQAFHDEPVEWFNPGDVVELRDTILQVIEGQQVIAGQELSDKESGDHVSSETAPSAAGWRPLVDALIDSP